MINWTFVIVLALICGAVCAVIAQQKNRSVVEGFFFGALFGVIGLVVVICQKPGLPKAPDGMRAVKCPRCNALQNIPSAAAGYDCWQCHANVPTAGRTRS